MSQSNDTVLAFGGSALLVAGAAIGNDLVTPFYSIIFGIGSLGAYYLAISSGPLASLLVGSSVVTAFILQGIVHRQEDLLLIASQVPAIVIFFLSLACLPGFLPTLLIAETEAFQTEIVEVETKVKELQESIQVERKERIEDRSNDDKEELLRVTSQSTQLTAFLRDALQASSTKEIYQLLFSNITKAYGAQEVALMTLIEGGQELVISKAAHPEYLALEGNRIDLNSVDLLRTATEKSVPMLLPQRVLFHEPDLGAKLLLPIRQEGHCVALIGLGKTRNDKPIETQDAYFLGGLAELAGYAAEQLSVVLKS